MKRFVVLAILLGGIALLPVLDVVAADRASLPPDAQGNYSWSGDIQPDQGQGNCPPLTVTVNGNVNTGAVTMGVGSMDVGTSSHQNESSTTYYDPGGGAHPSGTGVVPNPGGMTVSEPAGSATGICDAIVAAKGMAKLDNAETGEGTDGHGAYVLKFEQDDCKYTLKVTVTYPRTGGSVVTVSDGGL